MGKSRGVEWTSASGPPSKRPPAARRSSTANATVGVSSRTPMAQETFRCDFRRSFLTGLGALVPTILTVLVLIELYRFGE